MIPIHNYSEHFFVNVFLYVFFNQFVLFKWIIKVRMKKKKSRKVTIREADEDLGLRG
jgi:hypothetical protein